MALRDRGGQAAVHRLSDSVTGNLCGLDGLNGLNALDALDGTNDERGSGEWGAPAPPHAAVNRWKDSGVTMR